MAREKMKAGSDHDRDFYLAGLIWLARFAGLVSERTGIGGGDL